MCSSLLLVLLKTVLSMPLGWMRGHQHATMAGSHMMAWHECLLSWLLACMAQAQEEVMTQAASLAEGNKQLSSDVAQLTAALQVRLSQC